MEALGAVVKAGVHQDLRSHDVGLQEHAGIPDGTVHVALRCKIHHHIRPVGVKEAEDRLPVCDVGPYKAHPGGLHGFLEGGDVAGVGETVQTQNLICRVMGQFIVNEIGPDKTGTAGHKEFSHRRDPPCTTSGTGRIPSS